MAIKGNTTAVNGVSTEIIPADLLYGGVFIKNTGTVQVHLTWGASAAAIDEGVILEAAGTAGDLFQLSLGSGSKFPGACYAWADGANCDLQWHVFPV